MNISRRILLLAIIGRGLLDPVPLSGQDVAPPVLRAGSAPDTLRIDGLLLEPAWAAADATDTFTQTAPAEGAPPTRRTTVRVLADPRVLVIGVMCEDDPDSIVSFSVSRDAGMQAEDYVRIALGPFRDGRSGYVFAVNPRGARYDSLITSGGDAESVEWDGIWEAATASTSNGSRAERPPLVSRRVAAPTQKQPHPTSAANTSSRRLTTPYGHSRVKRPKCSV